MIPNDDGEILHYLDMLYGKLFPHFEENYSNVDRRTV